MARVLILGGLLLGLWGVQALQIKVVDFNDGTVKRTYSDSSAAFQERSYLLPTTEKEAIMGFLVYPNPRNACSTVVPSTNDSYIAYVSEYSTCPDKAEFNLKTAGYLAMVAYTASDKPYLSRTQFIPQALIVDPNFAYYLTSTVLPETNNSSDIQLVMWDNSFAKLEQLFIIFGSILLVAVFLSVCVFCSSLFCRMAIVRWRTRGLSRWQVRALPKRKYRKAKETTDTCSICLEEFKEGETVRVLPCDHVYHPKCVDEWLQKWNRTCPLCKSAIKRKGARAQQPPAQTDDNEASLLLPPQDHTSTVAEDQLDGATPENQYGATGATTVTFRSSHKSSRGHSACSNSSSEEITGGRDQVTSAEIELSVGSPGEVGGRLSTSLYHTPLHSDEEDNTPSYATAHSGRMSMDHDLTPQQV